jgi:hypothetical protein
VNACRPIADACDLCGTVLAGSRQQATTRRYRRARGLPVRCRPCSGRVRPEVDWAALEVRDGEPLSLREIGEAAGVSFEAVRQIETRALIRLRVRLEALGYTAADVLAYLDGLAPGRPEPAMGDE